MKLQQKILTLKDQPLRRNGEKVAREEIILLHEISAVADEINFWRTRRFFAIETETADECEKYCLQWLNYMDSLKQQLRDLETKEWSKSEHARTAGHERVLAIRRQLADEITTPVELVK